MKALGFIIHSNILIALAALSLALATQVQLGWQPQMNASLVVIFFATLFDYNFHKIKAVRNNPESIQIEKLKWAAEHLTFLKTVMIASFIGLAGALFMVKAKVIIVIILLALISFAYSFSSAGKQKYKFRLLKITGMKTLLIASVWTVATVFVPVLQMGYPSNYSHVFLLFAERFTFIFAIAIPFDIRDMEIDSLSGLKTIPLRLGKNRALKFSNLALLLSLFFATVHYAQANLQFILPAYLISIISTMVFTNNKAIRNVPFYYHGILDGSILMHGILIYVSFYLLL